MVSKKFTKKQIALGILCMLFVITLLTFYIWHQAESIRLGYQTRKLEEDIASIKKEIEQLEAERASLLSLERVEKIATHELGMSPPEDIQILHHESTARKKKEDR
ncbi:MAG: cell division protein FtsL [Candidatus Aminicenantes bacterium]|jgi:cell division protein FtsL